MFPHHECEIAQSECVHQKPFARYWIHNNMVTVDGVKMGKSLGNSITVKDALQQYPALVIRYFVLMSHYRSSLDFSDAALDAAAKGLKRLHDAYKLLSDLQKSDDTSGTGAELDVDKFKQEFEFAMNDDFNTPQAIAALFNLVKEINTVIEQQKKLPARQNIQAALDILNRCAGDVLGLLPGEEQAVKDSINTDSLITILIELRNELRKNKNFTLADKIRDELKKAGILLKDTAEGSRWEKL